MQLEFTSTINTAISRFPSNIYVCETTLTQKSLSKPLKSIRIKTL